MPQRRPPAVCRWSETYAGRLPPRRSITLITLGWRSVGVDNQKQLFAAAGGAFQLLSDRCGLGTPTSTRSIAIRPSAVTPIWISCAGSVFVGSAVGNSISVGEAGRRSS